MDKGADPGLANINGSSALHFAASRGLASLVKRMLDTGTVPADICDKKRNTPLHSAGRACEIETCRILLNKGASLEATNEAGETPLHLAAEENNLEVIELFVESKFRSLKEKEGKTA